MGTKPPLFAYLPKVVVVSTMARNQLDAFMEVALLLQYYYALRHLTMIEDTGFHESNLDFKRERYD